MEAMGSAVSNGTGDPECFGLWRLASALSLLFEGWSVDVAK
jgi:hypothetical protein